jgi:hypothetical protein
MVGVKGGQERAIAVICLLLLTTKIDTLWMMLGAAVVPLRSSRGFSDFKIQIKVISQKHRRPDRHNLSLMNPQQYFFGCASVRYRHLSTSIA